MNKIKVGILGATGMVGQRFIQLLDGHPWFEITELAASERRAGKNYEDSVGDRWKLETVIPEKVRRLPVKECRPGLDCRIVFSALDADVAGPVEEEFARAGYAVSSNSRNHRMDADVPLLVPEVNEGHLDVIEKQKKKHGNMWKRYLIVRFPASTSVGYTLNQQIWGGVVALNVLENTVWLGIMSD